MLFGESHYRFRRVFKRLFCFDKQRNIQFGELPGQRRQVSHPKVHFHRRIVMLQPLLRSHHKNRDDSVRLAGAGVMQSRVVGNP